MKTMVGMRENSFDGWVLLVVALALFGFGSVFGQSCVPFTGSPLTGGKCNSIVTYSDFLLLPGETYEQACHHPSTHPSIPFSHIVASWKASTNFPPKE